MANQVNNVPSALDLSLLTLNVRGLNNCKKRRSLFDRFRKQKPDLVLLQETHSRENVVKEWDNEWGNEIIYSHGTNDSRGVCIMFKKGLDYVINDSVIDQMGRYIIINITVRSTGYSIINVYAPNKQNEQYVFYSKLSDIIERKCNVDPERILIGGDFNIPLNPQIDKKGGIITGPNKANLELQGLIAKFDLVDVWRVKNPNKIGFTW